MNNLGDIIVILCISIVILSIVILKVKDKSNEYFQECRYPGEGNIPSADCNSVGCSKIGYACRTWCGLNSCLNG